MSEHTTSNKTLQDVLQSFRDAAHNNRDLGDLFERLIANFLRTDPQYNFSDVWLWSEWPDRWGADTGIDLVARVAGTGDYWAFQCKFYLPEHSVSRADIDSFLAASGRRFETDEGQKSFANRIIVTTTDRWSKHAEDTLDNQVIPVEKLSEFDLQESPIDWSQYVIREPEGMKLRSYKKELRPHQVSALDDVIDGFETHDRGKLIMACGTGKTYTALRIMEELVPEGGRVLFLAPSISLVAQSLREWTIDARSPFNPIVVCSDTKVGRDNEDSRTHDLPFPATTDPDAIMRAVAKLHEYDSTKRTVIFCTYQSISQVGKAQELGLDEFDLIICDEAHRTTGLTLDGEEDSEFVKVHSNEHVRAQKRLYMTATPRIFADASKTKAADKDAVLYSMDDETRYGPQFHRLGFGQAVRDGLLCDYRVLLVAVNESRMAHTANVYGAQLDDGLPKAVDTRFISKIFGSYKGLSKTDVKLISDEGEEDAPLFDQQPMRRAIAFSSSIKNSKTLTDTFPKIVDLYKEETKQKSLLTCEFDHVDGGMNALIRQRKLAWLKEDTDDYCRVLSNARCLSEGIDVPALDGVIFFDTRNSVVDIVQSVGRVMRKPPAGSGSDKQYGYIILPVGIPQDKLTDYDNYINSDPQFQGIWKIIKALRAHDESLVDEAEFRNKIQVIDGGGDSGGSGDEKPTGVQLELDLPPLPIGEISEAVYTAIPKKLGDTAYWHDWAKDVARIAKRVVERIHALLDDPHAKETFATFLKSLQNNISPAVDEKQAVELLAQHLITKPVFDSLFPVDALQERNPVSQAMDAILTQLDRFGVDSETEGLSEFYESIARRADLAKSEKSRQELIRSLYDSFFATAFEDVAKDLGIVYTPVEIVDFILQSANDILQEHFETNLSAENVHLLDPFTGTGTFITRLLQNEELITQKDLKRKYESELHANEIVLLAYYVASVNIESAYRARFETPPQEAEFPGIVLTDTFMLLEDRPVANEFLLVGNTERIERQAKAPIRVIVGNPPYSVAQGGAKYPRLDGRISDTYAHFSESTNKNSLYDSYIRAIRWASDRIAEQGVVAYVTNGGWLDSNVAAGVRKCFEEEFSAVYVFNLRGNQRTSGELSRMEGGKVFGSGSRAPIAITLLVKSADHQGPGKIYYHDIGDYLSTREKLDIIDKAGSYRKLDWEQLEPNKHYDWINQRSEDFYELKPLHGGEGEVFSLRQRGVETSRDPWVYDFNKTALTKRIEKMVAFYNAEVDRISPELSSPSLKSAQREDIAKKKASTDKTRIKWTRGLYKQLARQQHAVFDGANIVKSLYRPFSGSYLYYSTEFNEYYKARLWPTPAHQNLVIQTITTGATAPFVCLMSNVIPDLNILTGGQCYPLYFYEKLPESAHASLLDVMDDQHVQDGYVRRDAITDEALADFRQHYSDKRIGKEDIFYYVYGVLHSKDYRKRYAADLKKDWPRVPFTKDFWVFSEAGKRLGQLHTGFETVKPYDLEEFSDQFDMMENFYTVEKMRFAGSARDPDRSIIQVNSHLRLEGIPEEAHRYIVNGKSALEWILERYQYTKDRDTGIINDPNEWSDDPRYIVDLIKRIVTVSVETVKIIDGLPKLEK
ncbi:DEAD/DEAH box helicase [Orrella sp. 11846]|uniref:DEAD/DEAH box helicase n=1 Tax=Orrella sp. 11846 TaxID=3409913 RepID=UPI003B59C27F